MGHQKQSQLGYMMLLMGIQLILVMDGDGEDSPNNIINLLDVALEKKCIVVASRKRRYESVFYKIFYFLYCLLFFYGLRMNGIFRLSLVFFLKTFSILSHAKYITQQLSLNLV